MPSNQTLYKDRPAILLEQLPAGCRQFLIVLACVTAVCYGTELICGKVLHLGYIPYNWPMISHDYLMDFTRYIDQFKMVHTMAFFQGKDAPMYPMPMMMCYWALYAVHVGGAGFAVLITVVTLAAAVWATRSLMQAGLATMPAVTLVGVTYVLSYPLFFEYQSGNVELIVWVAICLGLWRWMKGDTYSAAALFGLAAAFKLVPFVYLGLLFSKKRYKECAFGCGVAVVVTVLSLWLIGPGIGVAWHATQMNIAAYRDTFMLYLFQVFSGFDHSLFGVVKLVAGPVEHHLGIDFNVARRSALLSAYMAVVGIVGLVVYFLRIRKLPAANQVLCLTLAAILLPPMSFDYTLLHLYAPWLILSFVAMRAARDGVVVPGLKAAFVCLAISLAPLSEVIFKDVCRGGQVRSLAMLALFVVALRYPFGLGETEGVGG